MAELKQKTRSPAFATVHAKKEHEAGSIIGRLRQGIFFTYRRKVVRLNHYYSHRYA